MKLLELVWRDPTGSLLSERFDAEKFKVRTDPGWLKLMNGDGVVRIVPSDKVHLVQFIEKEEEPRIVSPHAVPKFQPS